MSLTAIALTIAQAASPLPAVIETEQQLNARFAGLPCFEHQGTKHCVRSIAVSGKKADMEAARARLTSEGWPSAYRADQSGKTILSVDPRNRTLDEAWTLTNRFASREFGPLQADFVTLPERGAK